MLPRRLALCLIALSLLATGCWRSKPRPTAFDVVRTSPVLGADQGPLLLNDTVTVYFSDPVLALSVTSDTVSVLDAEGHQVPGTLRVGSNWVTFEPRPPLQADLSDGSFRPGSTYRVRVAGYPRPDAVRRASDGKYLDAARSFEFRTAATSEATLHWPAPLRPVADLPFVLRPYDVPQPLAADAPQLHLHFTLPILPSSVTPESFAITCLGSTEHLEPRRIRVVTSRLDDFPGSTIEIDLGTAPRLLSGGLRPLTKDDWVSVSVMNVASPLLDYGGNPVFATSSPCWTVVPGTSIALLEWPTRDGVIVEDDSVLPGFEAVSGMVRPCVRVEAGDGSLGVFQPSADTVLTPGVPFDRGDGVQVTSRGTTFPFLGIDIPPGVTVTVDGRGGPVQLLSAGSIRVSGAMQLAGISMPLQSLRPGTAVQELIDAAPVALVAAGDITVRGRIGLAGELAADRTGLLVAAAGGIRLLGDPLPYNTILAVEPTLSVQSEPKVLGLRGQVITTIASFTYGMAEGGHWTARGASPWRSLPKDRDGGTLRMLDVENGLRVSWQTTVADAVRAGEPDLTPGRVSRAELAADQQNVVVGLGCFVRFLLEADLPSGGRLPAMREIRLLAH